MDLIRASDSTRIPPRPDHLSAWLERLLYGNSGPHKGRAGFFDKADKPRQGGAVCEKIIYYQYSVGRFEVFL